ncbi:MAG TPA: tetratricopeptide repeat protein [Caldimonas sp.]|nr:tetratricopeptide repeat protein [Caldimonas sp.]
MRVASLAVLVAALVAGCAAAPPQAPPDSLFADRLFAPPREPIRTDIFAMSDAMRRYLTVDIADQIRMNGAQLGLVDALQKHAQLKLEYDAGRTKDAAATFASRTGNCLSLVIMTAAFAKELGLPVAYQSAYLDESWSRTGNLLISSGHVNVTLGRRLFDFKTPRDRGPMTIDFLPPEAISGLRSRDIGEATIVAMYANNRAAEALADGRLDDAYAWAAASVRSDPTFAGGYNTLGVVYLRHGNFAEAERSFVRVLDDDAKDTRALANLAETYGRQGRSGDAEATRRRLAALETYPPFHFFDLGMAAMRREDWRAARELFAREVARADGNHEFHFWLGVADWRLGEESAAMRHLALAIDNSVTRDQHQLYAAKLAWLQAHRQPH